jgi:hypothetical protein
MVNFPFGVTSFGVPLIGSGPIIATGKFFFVDSVIGANGNYRGTDVSTPLATIQAAIDLCVADRGDVIICAGRHAETLTTAGQITLNKAGVRIISVGRGQSRATLTYSNTAATVVVSAAGCSIEGFNLTMTGVDAVVTGISITGTDCEINNCRVVMAGASAQAVNCILIGGTGNNAKIVDCEFIATVAGADSAIQCATVLSNIIVQRCRFSGDFAQAAIYNLTNAALRWVIMHNIFYILGAGKAIVLPATATGIIAWNCGQITANIAAGGSMTAAAALKAENYFQETAGIASSAVLDPTSAAIS